MTWAVVPAAGSGSRFGGELPKQYLPVFGRPLLRHALERLFAHPAVEGAVVVLAADDRHWPGWTEISGRPLRTAVGGAERAASVLSGVRALPDKVRTNDWVLVHDAARACLRRDDLERLLDHGGAHPVGAILAAPVADTLKRADARGEIEATEPRESLWRALTPQMFRRGLLERALEAALAVGAPITDEASAVERLGLRPLLVEGAADNIKLTGPADLALVEFVLGRLQRP